jgi:phage repressor protein C with HTH and peptisase S24 domain
MTGINRVFYRSVNRDYYQALNRRFYYPQFMKFYGQRVKAARDHKGLSQAQLAKALGITQPTVFSIEKSPAKGSKYTLEIAKLTGVSLDWLDGGVGPMIPGEGAPEPSPPPAPRIIDMPPSTMPRDLPVLGGALCGEDGLFEFNGQALDNVRRPPRLMGVKDAYALYVYGDCMSPWREQGDLVMVHPHQPVKIGDYVVVQLKQEADGAAMPAYIKKLVRRTAKDVRLQQYNPAKEISISTARIWAIHRIIDWSELMSI